MYTEEKGGRHTEIPYPHSLKKIFNKYLVCPFVPNFMQASEKEQCVGMNKQNFIYPLNEHYVL